MLCALVLTGCSGGSGDDDPAPRETGPVPVPVPTATSTAVEGACQAVTQALPATLGDDVVRRPVTGDPERTAAWGDPAVTLTCGTSALAQAGVDGELFALGLPGSTCVNETPDPRQCLSLLRRDSGSANLFTTSGRSVQVQVQVPDQYDTQVIIRMLSALVLLPAT